MTPLELAQEQLEAYNTRDLDRFCQVFSDDVICYSLKDEKVLVNGMQEFRKTYEELFAASPNLHCRIDSRVDLGGFVIDKEYVTGRRGNTTIQAIAIYRMDGGKISRVWFIT